VNNSQTYNATISHWLLIIIALSTCCLRLDYDVGRFYRCAALKSQFASGGERLSTVIANS